MRFSPRQRSDSAAALSRLARWTPALEVRIFPKASATVSAREKAQGCTAVQVVFLSLLIHHNEVLRQLEGLIRTGLEPQIYHLNAAARILASEVASTSRGKRVAM